MPTCGGIITVDALSGSTIYRGADWDFGFTVEGDAVLNNLIMFTVKRSLSAVLPDIMKRSDTGSIIIDPNSTASAVRGTFTIEMTDLDGLVPIKPTETLYYSLKMQNGDRTDLILNGNFTLMRSA